MASIETLDLSDNPSKADGENGVQQGTLVQGSPAKGVDEAASLPKPDGPQADSLSASPSPASSSTPLRGAVPNGQPAPGTTNAPTLSMPHPKKFSSVNINKKFLERSSSSSGNAQTASTSLSSKVGSAAQKPTLPSQPSHSRLVTAKLTAGPQPATLTGPGWSRPSSTGSQGPAPASGTNPKPSSTPVPGLPHVPQSALAGKVIHPQPRSAIDGLPSNDKDHSSKPAWNASKLPGARPLKADTVDDFPTAAESAQVRAAKLNEKRQAAQAAQAQKQALAAEADAFRGVHLKNTHHWDEDEGDDGDFLGGVIDFGDGRQYKVQPSEPSQSPPPNHAELGADSSIKHPDSDHPVSKEERFADDFDRSWPRSRPPESSSRFSNGPPSSVSSQSMHSPQESSRVLFNERSNRLEPYSNSHPSRYGNREHFPRRDSRSDHTVSPTESRNGRESLSHRPGVQLLQKPSPSSEIGDGPQRSRVFGDRFGSEHSRFRDKDGPRRDYGHPPHMARTPSESARSRDGDRSHFTPSGPARSPVVGSGRPEDHPRRGSMGPPPIPALPHAPQSQRDDGRQVPPHLAKLQTDSQPPAKTAPPSLGRPTLEPPSATSEAPSTHSPAASHASLSPLVEGSTMPIQDIDEVRKLAMHSAAERAKLRRQQEEAEIERQKERARKKAAELEAKIKAAEEAKRKETEEKAKEQQKPSDAEVIGVIEEAVSSVTLASASSSHAVPDEANTRAQPPPPVRTVFGRTPSGQGLPRTAPARRSSFATSDVASPATEADSWRSKAAPLSAKPVLSTHGPSKAATSPVSVLPPPPLSSSFPTVDSFSIADGEELDVVDFSELGKLVGEEVSPPQPEQQEPTPRTRPRPVATDFFEEKEPNQQGANGASREPETWRRPQPLQLTPEHHRTPSDGHHQESHSRESLRPSISPPANSGFSHRRPSQSSDHGRPHIHSLPHPPKSPTSSAYREASMSTLDDTMARIRGALTVMQKTEPSKPEESGHEEQDVHPPHRQEPAHTHTHHQPHHVPVPAPIAHVPEPTKPKWLPPALRPKVATHDDTPREVFDVTATEPPRSPKPAWKTFKVHVPHNSVPRDAISRKQLHMSKTQPHVRADIYSFEPPIEGMNRKDFSINDIHFRKPAFLKGKPKYIVSFPSKAVPSVPKSGSGPVVNLPSKLNPSNTGTFGRKSDASNVASWRKPPPSPLATQPSANQDNPQILETVSRSPPPESSSVKTTVTSSQSPTVSVTGSAKQQQQRAKMGVGADVAFYRDSRAGESKEEAVAVKFIVSSELEEESSSKETMNKIVSKVNDATSASLEGKKQSTGDYTAPSPARSNNMPWPKSPKALHTKDSPSRAPDPEHLKAVWSSTSDKSPAPSVNSLAKIGDDLGAVPFTIQDVKSEGGTPPPPSSGPPSRMSLHDVTRAFQQVPTQSVSSSTSRSGPLSPPTNHRQPPPSHPPNSVPTPNMRPMYPPYGSPMMSSPSPTMVYPMSMTPSPVPRHMTIPPSQYPQPMWMTGPPPPGTMMRPMASPYMTQLMPYPPPPGYPAPPPQNMQGGMHPPPQPNGTPGRANGVPLISPVLAHAHANPMYTPSPVLMHAQAVAPPPHTHTHSHPYPNPGQPPRQGQPPRGGYDHHSHPSGPYAHTPSHPHPPQGALYNAVPSNSFDRPSW